MINLAPLAVLLIVAQRQPVLIQDSVDKFYFGVQYPFGMVATNYDWNVQFSTNLQTMPFEYVTQVSRDTNGQLYVPRDYPNAYYRLVGTPLP